VPELRLSGAEITGYNGLEGLRGVKRPLQPGGGVTDEGTRRVEGEDARRTGKCARVRWMYVALTLPVAIP